MTNLMYCQICQNRSRRRVCKDCIKASEKPCSMCGKPTQTITHDNKPTKSDKCLSCRTSERAKKLRGKTCRVCKNSFEDNTILRNKRVCDNCLDITKPCLYCGKETPKYRINGVSERKFCSISCASKSISFEIRSVAGKKSNAKKWEGHIRKTHQNKVARKTREYKEWREAIYQRDNYTCQKCGMRSGNGKRVELHPHHIKPFATFPEYRYDVSNGITLCSDCHKKEHKHIFIGKTQKNNLGK